MTITTANCPSCGAPVEWALGASIVVVCEFCNSAIARTDRDLRDLGKVADLVDTRSPLAVGTTGRYEGRAFTLTGRAQLRHEAGGVWDEWYATFDDGTTGWLAEAQGRFYMTFAVESPPPGSMPELGQLRPGAASALGGLAGRYVVNEIGAARTVAAKGEIPWLLVPGESYYYADFSGEGGAFATVDYGETPPRLYAGREATLASLGIAASDTFDAERKRVAAVRVTCPNCGGPLDLRAPESERATCPNCNGLLDVAGGNLVYLQALSSRSRPMIPLGSRGSLGEGELVVIGYLERHCKVDGVVYNWQEYLLYDPQIGFRWLVHDSGHWLYVKPVSPGDVVNQDKFVYLGGTKYKKFQTVTAYVDAVFGEFYWKVEEGESVFAVDYVAPPQSLSREVTGREENWSHGEYRSAAEVAKAFKIQGLPKPTAVGMAQPNPVRGPLAPWFALLFVGFAVGLFVFATADRRQVLAETYAFEPVESAQATRVVFTEPFELKSGENIRVETYAPVSNSWAYLEGDLVNVETGLVQNFSTPIEYYYGVSDGESWSEGSQTSVVHVSALPAGRYSLRLEAQWEKWESPIAIKVGLKQDVPRILHFVLLLAVLAIGPVVLVIRRAAFEGKRWAESMYSS